MNLVKKVFDSFFPAWVLISVIAFAQLSCAFVLGAMADQGMEGRYLWLLPSFGLLVVSVMMAMAIVLTSAKKDGYFVARFRIAPAFLVFYSLIVACFLCFVLFGLLSLLPDVPMLHRTGLCAIALPVSVLVMDALGFFGATALRG